MLRIFAACSGVKVSVVDVVNEDIGVLPSCNPDRLETRVGRARALAVAIQQDEDNGRRSRSGEPQSETGVVSRLLARPLLPARRP
jgi:hypothetical protein